MKKTPVGSDFDLKALETTKETGPRTRSDGPSASQDVPKCVQQARTVRLYKCKACGAIACTRTVLDDVYGDARYRCAACGHTWTYEGADA